MNNLKSAITKVKIDGVLQDISLITGIDAVAMELNEDNTIKKSLRDGLMEFAAALTEKASSTAVTREIQQACKELYNKILGKTTDDTTIDEAYDTLKEIAEWIGAHGNAASTLINDVSTLKTNVENLVKQIENFGKTSVEVSETNGNIKVDGQEVEVYKNPGQNIFVASTAAQATAAEGKMQEGDVLFQIVPNKIELKDAANEIKTANHFIGNLATLVSAGTLVEKTNGFSEITLAGGNPAKSNLPSYKIGAQYTGTVIAGSILYLDGYRYGAKTFGTANLATGGISGGNSMLSVPEIIMPKGYYKIKNVDEYTDTDNIFNMIHATFDSSGNVTDITAAFNVNNECVEYLGESYLVTE